MTKAFYKTRAWTKLRRKILRAHKYECQRCKSRGRYTKADTVHHVCHVKDYPELALSENFVDSSGKEQSNLIPLCRSCHEEAHNFRQKESEPLTSERW